MLLAVALVGTACSGDHPEPEAAPPVASEAPAPLTYDATLEPAAAVLSLVPEDATLLTVTDFEQIRLDLGASTLTGEAPQSQRDEFWRRAGESTAALSEGLLRPVDEQLAAEFAFTQDDVLWEARFSGPAGDGWVLRFRDDLDMSLVQNAVTAGVPPLAGAEVGNGVHLAGAGVTLDPEQSWAADAELPELVAVAPANATYVERSCIPFETAFGPGIRVELATQPALDYAALDELGPFSVTFGGSLATARLGDGREDAFERLRLGEGLPSTEPEFGLGYRNGVVDPQTGRIGFDMGDPAVAADLAIDRQLPFAVCSA